MQVEHETHPGEKLKRRRDLESSAAEDRMVAPEVLPLRPTGPCTPHVTSGLEMCRLRLNTLISAAT